MLKPAWWYDRRGETGLAEESIQGVPTANINLGKLSGVVDIATAFPGGPGEAVGLTLDVAGTWGGRDTEKKAQQAIVSGLGGLVGAAIGGIPGYSLGKTIGGAAIRSWHDGVLGDAFDARDMESARDRAENRGYSREQTAEAATMEGAGVHPGMSDRYGVSLSPRLSDLEAANPFGARTPRENSIRPSRKEYDSWSGGTLDYSEADMSKLGQEAIATDHSISNPGNLGDSVAGSWSGDRDSSFGGGFGGGRGSSENEGFGDNDNSSGGGSPGIGDDEGYGGR